MWCGNFSVQATFLSRILKKVTKKIVIVIETNYADFTLQHVFNDIFSIMSTIEIYRKKTTKMKCCLWIE